jgi:hypothetical protein
LKCGRQSQARVKDHRHTASDEKLSDGGYVSVAQVYVKDSCLHQVLFNEHKSFTHASRGPNHFASSFFDSCGEIKSDERFVFDNQYRDLIQHGIYPTRNVAPVAGFRQQS